MKKIVAVAALASMVMGATFAADISFSYTGSNYFKSSGGNLKYDDRSDCMSLAISSDVAGAVVDFDTEDGSLVQDEYYGWMTFAIPTGNLQLTAGVWNGRYVNRVRADAGDLDGEDFELYKPGVINGVAGKDSDNLTEGKISMVAAYTNPEALPGTLLAKFGLVKSTWNPDAASASNVSHNGGVEDTGKDAEDGDLAISAGFVGELAYRQDDTININLAVKSLEKKKLSIGFWASPLMIENLNLTVGGTFATYTPYDSTAKDWSENSGTEWGVDLRARYKINDEISITTMHNISSGYDKTADNNTLILWDMLNVNYKMDEKITLGCTLNAVFDNLDSDHVFTGADLTTSPYIRIDATEKAAITTALRIEATGINPAVAGHENVDITIPVIFAFNY